MQRKLEVYAEPHEQYAEAAAESPLTQLLAQPTRLPEATATADELVTVCRCGVLAENCRNRFITRRYRIARSAAFDTEHERFDAYDNDRARFLASAEVVHAAEPFFAD